MSQGRRRASDAVLRRRHRRGVSPGRREAVGRADADLAEALAGRGAVIVVAHGNSIRALRMVLQNIPEDEIAELEIPTGIPYRVVLDDGLNILTAEYLGDPAAAAAAAEAVARQAG